MPRKRPDRPPPTFFLDRGLGRVHVAGAIRSAGFDVVLMADVFESDGQYVGDDEWISLASDRGWIALTKDVSITRAHTDALRASTLRTFALPNAHLTGVERLHASRSTCIGSSSARARRARSSMSFSPGGSNEGGRSPKL